MAETNWWDGDKDLVADIYSSLKKEEGKLVIYKGTSPHLHIRRYLVDWLAVQAECFNMTSHTIHLAVFLLDRIMDRDNSSNEAHLHIVAMACLLIASKFHLVGFVLAEWDKGGICCVFFIFIKILDIV